MLLTDKQIKDYRKIYHQFLLKNHKDRELAHAGAWKNYRPHIIAAHPIGWWTVDHRESILKEITIIEDSIKSP